MRQPHHDLPPNGAAPRHARWAARRFFAAAALACGVAGALVGGRLILAEDPSPLPPAKAVPRSELPLADPVIDSQVEFKSRRTTTWEQDGAKWLYLEGDTTLAVGTYGFRGARATVRIEREEQPGRLIRHVWVYIDDATPLRGRGPVTTQSPRLLVTTSTTGDIDLVTDLLRKEPSGEAMEKWVAEVDGRKATDGSQKNGKNGKAADGEPDMLSQTPLVAGRQFLAESRQRFDQHLASISGPMLDVPPGSPIVTEQMMAARNAMRSRIASESLARANASLAARGKTPDEGTPAAPVTTTTPPAPPAPPATATTQPTATADQPAPTTATTTTAAAATTTTTPPAAATTPGGTQPAAAAGAAPRVVADKPADTSPGLSASGSTAPVIAPSDTSGRPPTTTPQERIFADKGFVLFGADRVVFQQGNEGENLLLLMGNVRVMYRSYDNNPGATLTAHNAVIFLAGGDQLAQLSDRKAGIDDVKGIYLEDNVVATYDQYTVRAPRVFYDVTNNRAIVLDAVMFGYDVQRKIPIYIRAEKLRQESANAWSAQNAALTNSEFGVPHFSIAARTITFRQEKREDGSMAGPFTARDVGPKLGKTPMFYWPYMAGDVNQNVPLRKASFGYSSHDGVKTQTTWDLFALAGQPKPRGVDLTGNIDYMGRHGPGLGFNLDYDLPRQFGTFDTYILPYDTGTDEIGGRRDIEFNGDTRGYALWRHRHILPRHWELSLELAYVSDPTFLEEFFRSEADTSKPYETSFYLKKQEDDWAFTFLGKYDLNDFVAQTTVLQAPGYTVDKLPELGYYRVGTSLWSDRLTYYSETRGTRMWMRPGEDSPYDRGFNDSRSELLFGIPDARTSFEDAFDAAGLPDDTVYRLDTRHELQAPMKAGLLDVVPYVAGRFTGYDQDFDDFNDDAENMRLWGSTGVRLGTQFARAFDNVDNRMLDVHRLRHIIEPSADLFFSASSVDPEAYPVFDPDVEGIGEGAGARLGVRNTLQTQRGGPGRWRNVDWLVVNTDLILRGDDAEDEVSIARFVSYRPEYSLGGDHFHADAMWLVTDSLAVVGEALQNLEDHFLAQWRTGIQLRHSPDLSTFVDYTEIEDLDERLLSYGFNYRLSSKYAIGFSHTYDLARGESRGIDARLTRRLPRWTMEIFTSYDDIDDEATLGVVLYPDGLVNMRPSRLFSTDSRRD